MTYRKYDEIDKDLNTLLIGLTLELPFSIPENLSQCGDIPNLTYNDLKISILEGRLGIKKIGPPLPVLRFAISDIESKILFWANFKAVFVSGFITYLSIKSSWLFAILELIIPFLWIYWGRKAYDLAILRLALRTELGFSILYGLKQIKIVSPDFRQEWVYQSADETISKILNKK
jgi:hypothetical protein